jgi:hypothetical protein
MSIDLARRMSDSEIDACIQTSLTSIQANALEECRWQIQFWLRARLAGLAR